MSTEKNRAIAESMRKTREKRLAQDCRVFKIKVDSSSLKPSQQEAMKMQFVEAKWIVNEAIRIRRSLQVYCWENSGS